MRLVLLGPQGAGKGTQAQRLAALTGARHIATGDMVRAEIAARTTLGRIVQEYNRRGELVPDEIIVSMATKQLLGSASWILDGFPRNAAQAAALDGALATSGLALDGVVALEAPDDALVERLSGRRQSLTTGRIYHVTNNPAPCDDPGPFVQRDDDRPEVIRRRLQIYHAETQPLTGYYSAQGLLIAVDALQSIEAITGEIVAALEQRQCGKAPQAIKLPAASMSRPGASLYQRASAR